MQVSGVTVLCTAPPALDIPDLLKYKTLLHSLRTPCTPPAAPPDIQGIQFVLGSSQLIINIAIVPGANPHKQAPRATLR